MLVRLRRWTNTAPPQVHDGCLFGGFSGIQPVYSVISPDADVHLFSLVLISQPMSHPVWFDVDHRVQAAGCCLLVLI